MPHTTHSMAPFREVVAGLKAGAAHVLFRCPQDPAPTDDLLLRLGAEDQLVRAALPAGLALSLAKDHGWGTTPHWLLISPEGRELSEGVGQPSGEQVLRLMSAAGVTPRWEVRGRFQKENPLQGESWLEDLRRSTRLIQARQRVLRSQGLADRQGPYLRFWMKETKAFHLNTLHLEPMIAMAR